MRLSLIGMGLEIRIIESDDFIGFHIVAFFVRIEPFIDRLQGS